MTKKYPKSVDIKYLKISAFECHFRGEISTYTETRHIVPQNDAFDLNFKKRTGGLS